MGQKGSYLTCTSAAVSIRKQHLNLPSIMHKLHKTLVSADRDYQVLRSRKTSKILASLNYETHTYPHKGCKAKRNAKNFQQPDFVTCNRRFRLMSIFRSPHFRESPTHKCRKVRRGRGPDTAAGLTCLCPHRVQPVAWAEHLCVS